MGEIEHAGTAKAMPAIRTDEPTAATAEAATTSDDAVAGLVAGEILAEPTVRTATRPAPDTIAAERGMPPLRVPDKS
jgi:hypothetical protein